MLWRNFSNAIANGATVAQNSMPHTTGAYGPKNFSSSTSFSNMSLEYQMEAYSPRFR